MKKCSKCGGILSVYMFTNQPSSGDGKSAWCRKCKAAHERDRIRNNPELKEQSRINSRNRYRKNPELLKEKVREYSLKNRESIKKRTHKRYLKKIYNITPDIYNDKLVKQGGGCAICGSVLPGGTGRFHIDHDHKTGNMRGLLCFMCNSGLGMFKDDLCLFDKVYHYLDVHRHIITDRTIPLWEKNQRP